MATPFRPIPITTGGAPDLRDIVGRDEQAERVVRLLERDSVLLTGDRRIGKTSMSKLVEAQIQGDGRRVVRVSAERSSIVDFQESLVANLRTTVSGALRKEIDRWSLTVKAGLVEARRETEAAALDEVIRIALRDGERLTLIIDEVPVLARAMENRSPGTGSDLLIMLRRIRQESGQQLSMLLMGSMGFHHVSAAAPGAVNDVIKEAVGPLATTDAVYLARCLMLGAGVNPQNDQIVAEAVASQAENVPFYIQHVVKDARERFGRRMLNPSRVTQLVDGALNDGDDRWNLRHYRDRIPGYYGAADSDLVGAIIDEFAAASAPLSIDECLRRAAVQPEAAGLTRSRLVSLVEKLEQDHYLVKSGRESAFRSPLLQRAWLDLRR